MAMTESSDQKQQHLYKIIVIGDYAVGKTSIIKRYCEGYFTPNYKLTIGVDFAVKEVEINDNKITLQLWDVAGHERFGTMTRVYYKYAIAAIIVYDVTRASTFEAVTKWRDDINSKVALPNNDPIPLILLANKCDIEGAVVEGEILDEFIKDNGFLAWFQTSAQANINIDAAMNFLLEKVLAISKDNLPASLPNTGSGETVVLNSDKDSTDKTNGQEKSEKCCN